MLWFLSAQKMTFSLKDVTKGDNLAETCNLLYYYRCKGKYAVVMLICENNNHQDYSTRISSPNHTQLNMIPKKAI